MTPFDWTHRPDSHSLAATGSVAGRVTTTSGYGLSGATVITGGRDARTAATGDYIVTDVVRGPRP